MTGAMGSTDQDASFMAEALALARRADYATSPNPMVGCVIVRDGVVLGRGYHHGPGEPHAEVMAIRDAETSTLSTRGLDGVDVYVTLEPCAHQGRTPPCVTALIASRPRRVVIAMTDPNPLVSGRGLAALHEAGIEIAIGVGADQAAQLNEFFVTSMTKDRPFVTAKFAASLDGRIATRTGLSRWISSPESRAVGHRMRHAHDAILVGVTTVINDDPALTVRKREVGEAPVRNPVRVVLDSRARTPPTARLLSQAGRTLVLTSDRAEAEAVARLREANAEVVVIPDVTTGAQAQGIDIPAVLDELHRRGYLSVLVEGGAQVLGSVFDAGVVDKVVAFLGLRVIGGNAAPSAVGGVGVAGLGAVGRLNNVVIERAGGDLVVTGYCEH